MAKRAKVQVSFRLPAEVVAMIRELAAKGERSQSEAVAEAVVFYRSKVSGLGREGRDEKV